MAPLAMAGHPLHARRCEAEPATNSAALAAPSKARASHIIRDIDGGRLLEGLQSSSSMAIPQSPRTLKPAIYFERRNSAASGPSIITPETVTKKATDLSSCAGHLAILAL
jgi:hypothetical protein